jgi:predicted lysophospholipase L1 biosynthesis ABC-type transport system permease subunit
MILDTVDLFVPEGQFVAIAVEYAVLGLLAGIIGSGSAIAVTWVMSRWGNQPLAWRFHPGINLAGAILTAALVLLIGVAATWDVAARKPLGILRE